MKITVKDIIHDSDPRIRLKSKKVELPLNDEDRELLEAMITYVRDSQDEEIAEQEDLQPAVGIAAIQLGVAKQMIAVVVPDEEDETGETNIEYALVNPRIISESVQNSYLQGGEGCLSVPDVHAGHVFRHARVRVRAYDMLTDSQVTIRAEGFLAICLQHEIDHLSGILYFDRIDSKNPWKEDDEAEVY